MAKNAKFKIWDGSKWEEYSFGSTNVSGDYLPLSGGTITGDLTVSYDLYATFIMDSDGNDYVEKYLSGYSKTSHTHSNYVPLSGGTFTGDIQVPTVYTNNISRTNDTTPVTITGDLKIGDNIVLDYDNGNFLCTWMQLSNTGDATDEQSINLVVSDDSGVIRFVTPGDSGKVLMSNGTNVYWGTKNNTWRKIQVNSTDYKGTGTGTGLINFVAGNNISLTTDGNNLTIASTASGGSNIFGELYVEQLYGMNNDELFFEDTGSEINIYPTNIYAGGDIYVPEDKYAYFGTDQLASFRANSSGAFIVGSYGDMYFRPTLNSNSSASSVGVRLSQTMMRPEKTNTMALGAPSYAYKAVYAQDLIATKSTASWTSTITLTAGVWAVQTWCSGGITKRYFIYIDETSNTDAARFLNSTHYPTDNSTTLYFKCTSATIGGNYVFTFYSGSNVASGQLVYKRIG